MGELRTCKYCGTEYEKGTKYSTKEYCSSKCYHRGKEGKAGTKRTCEVCGNEFTLIYGNERMCSDQCKATALKEQKKINGQRYWKEKQAERIQNRPTATCKCCGEPVSVRKVYCSPQCKEKEKWKREIERQYGSWENYESFLKEKRQAKIKEMHERKQKEKEERTIIGTCVVCGNEFTTFNPAQKTCSKECGKRLRYAHKEKRIPKEQMIDKDITLEALYRRDSGVCYLCGGKCDWNDKQGNIVGASYPSIDHMIPISRGGFHTWGNVRLAHFKCNTVKSNELIPGIEQMIPQNAYEFKREVKPQKKTVEQYDKEGNLIAQYESTAEAERKTNIKQRGIQNCSRGECKTYGGYVWRYAP